MKYWIKEVEKFSKIVIYGAGYYGQKVLMKLQENGYSHKIIGFCVSKSSETDTLESYPIYTLDKLSVTDDMLVIVSLGSMSFNEVVANLENKDVKNWIDGRALIYKCFDIDKEEREKLEKVVNEYLEKERYFNGDNGIRASHVTYAYIRNAGDTFLSHCVRKYLDFKYYNIIPVAETVTEKTIESINETDVLIIGGGGLFLPDTNKNDLSGWQWAISSELLSKIKVPIIIYTIGYNFYRGQKPNELFKKSVNELIKKASFVGLRNSGSVDALKSIVDETQKHKIVLQPCITTITSDVLHGNKSDTKDVVALNMGFDRLNFRFHNEADRIRVFENVAKAIKQIEEKGYSIKYYCHNDVDEEYTHYLNQFKVNFEVINLSGALPQEIYDAYAKAEVVLGMRGHAQMIPFGLGKRIITLSSHDKMKWFLEDVDLLECYVDLNLIDEIESRIINVFDNLVNNMVIEEKLEIARRKIYNISEINKRNIIKIIKDYQKENV